MCVVHAPPEILNFLSSYKYEITIGNIQKTCLVRMESWGTREYRHRGEGDEECVVDIP